MKPLKRMHLPSRIFFVALTTMILIALASSVAVWADKSGSCKKPDGNFACGSGTGSCYCDKACSTYGDCCPDAVDLCGGKCQNCPSATPPTPPVTPPTNGVPFPKCGNSIIDQESEECDGNTFKSWTTGCPYTGGYYVCTKDCKISKEFCTGPIKTYECFDSDGGKKQYIAGYTKGTDESGNQVETKDYCTSAGLVEYYCAFPSGLVTSQLIGPAPFGCSVCSDGACKKPEEPPTQPLTCTDSDGGLNIFKAGTVSDNEAEKKSDYCTAGSYSGEPGALVEYYCGNTAKIESKTFGPNEGCYTCADGACLFPKPQPITKKDVLNWITNNCGEKII